jgi:hypothetical protein
MQWSMTARARQSADSSSLLESGRHVLQAVGLKPPRELVRTAECGQMSRVDHVGRDPQTFEGERA